MSAKVTVAIIGSTGIVDSTLMTKALFNAMIFQTREILFDDWKLKKGDITLVSGGSAFSDHVAVKLWLDGVMKEQEENEANFANLILHLPCKLMETDDQSLMFESDSCGSTLRMLHNQFSKFCEIDSIQDIVSARRCGATVMPRHQGFKRQNLLVGDVDYMIAFTWGESPDEPGGSLVKYAWDNSRAMTKIHIPLVALERKRRLMVKQKLLKKY